MKNITVKSLQAIGSLKDVPDDQLQWFIDRSRILELPAGASIFKPGELIPGPFIIISGKVRLCMPAGQELHEVGTYEAGAIGGNLPFSRAKVSNVITEVAEDLIYLQFPLNQLEEMIRSQFGLTQALVHVMANRIREYTAFEQQNEKMMALGKLSAGLAHELNNPAAAVVRGSVSLVKHLQLMPDAFRQVMLLRLDTREMNYLTDKLSDALSKTEKPVLSMMERSALEDDMLNWLDDHVTAFGADTAENLVDFGFSVSDLDEIKAHIPAAAISAVFNWISNYLVTEKIVVDIHEASGRIAGLVGAVKTFTHMDRGYGKQNADIHTGIRNTLTMLQYKIRNGNVQVVENFDTSLPEVNALIGELNQVWTNLLDNALDAMEPNQKGQLTITTGRARDCLRVTISDNGPGIPEDIKSRIFDPFFTTKEIGKGTGLGLDMVMRIIKQHKGAVKLQSKPGQTDFIVEIPINA
ncbi:Cyclic nucleotide-binding domain-containing protein [Pedobacter westerhofensis]|uniref:histidine kinase n=1 Tax=Pedobacter westerhofensis TaxID=425512 RepID=A0A521ATS2_9SPHI|nr:ATP-binding protein [Pedobacter westerhofensis]SMO38232.1 Cyclic nucleotide-binding domain-containing protein [Pedobacter westerhofensis]